MGFTTMRTVPTNDGGIDIIATRNDPILSGKYIIQCKDWQGNVGVKPVRELYGVIVSEDANKGILIVSSEFSQSAVEFARGKRLELIDGEQLNKLFSLYLKSNESKVLRSEDATG
jgi:restriction system protein